MTAPSQITLFGSLNGTGSGGLLLLLSWMKLSNEIVGNSSVHKIIEWSSTAEELAVHTKNEWPCPHK